MGLALSNRCQLIVIIVPFIDWGPLVERCVKGCLSLADENFRICLVSSGANDVPDKWTSDPRVSVIVSTSDGISQKRNLAIRACPDAAVYACIDSDAWPLPNWLGAARRVFEDDSDIWVVGGPNLSPHHLSPERVAVADALLSPLVSGPKFYTKLLSRSRDTADLPACNLLIRKAAIDAVGGFDESVDVGEDSILCQYVIALGKRIRFDRDVQVFHEPRCFGRPFVRQRIVSGYGIPPLLRRCWKTMGAAAVVSEISPALALLWLTGGWACGLLFPSLGLLWPSVLAAYTMLLLIETLRVTSRPRCWPKTAAALLVGNLAPGIGTLYFLAGGRLGIGRFYRNDEEASVTLARDVPYP